MNERKRSLQQNEIEKLRSLWQAGLDSGPDSGHLIDMNAIKAKARQRLLSQDTEQR